MQKQVILSEFKEIKSGVGKRGPWTLYKVKDQDGWEFTTFEAEWKNKLNNPITINYTEEQVPGRNEGQVFINRKITEERKYQPKQDTKRTDEVLGVLSEIQGQLTSMDMKLDRIERSTTKTPF